ncbi:hypothetical protein QCA50_000607 [Cerrena zonata]|uniref:DUF6533 domain-containing protein n=1 Tax=Cerrena zonata TaxID=2478898 RepID=A0AAW0GQT1_9APHY
MASLSTRSGEFFGGSPDNRTETSFLLAAATLCAFDILLTLPREFRCIWKKRFSAITVLYPVIRYCPLGAVLMQIIPLQWTSMNLVR